MLKGPYFKKINSSTLNKEINANSY